MFIFDHTKKHYLFVGIRICIVSNRTLTTGGTGKLSGPALSRLIYGFMIQLRVVTRLQDCFVYLPMFMAIGLAHIYT